MKFRNHTPRCPHGFSTELIRCDECKGRWSNQHGNSDVKPASFKQRQVRHAEANPVVPPSYRGHR